MRRLLPLLCALVLCLARLRLEARTALPPTLCTLPSHRAATCHLALPSRCPDSAYELFAVVVHMGAHPNHGGLQWPWQWDFFVRENLSRLE